MNYAKRVTLSCLIGLLFVNLSTVLHANEKIIPVKTETAQLKVVHEPLTLHGTINATLKSNLSLAVDGLLKELNVSVGDQIKEGDLLLKLDDENTRQKWLQARAKTEVASTKLREAQRQLAEGEQLHSKKHLAKNALIALRVERDVARSELAAAKAEEALIKHTLEQHNLYAPFSGIITQKDTELGEWLSSGNPAVTLVALDKVLFDVQVPQTYYARIQHAQGIQLHPDTAPGSVVPAMIDTVVPFGQSQSRTFLVRFKPTEANPLILPGTSARISLNFSTGEESVLISRDAVLHHADGGNSVFVIVDNKAQRRTIKLGKTEDNQVQVLDGLNPGDLVVIRGNELLREGTDVKLLP